VETSEQLSAAAESQGGISKKTAVENTTDAKTKHTADVVDTADDKHTFKPAEIVVNPREKVEVNLRTLLQAGVHFGHQTSRWNPAMRKYIYTTRNGIHIINLPETVSSWEKARQKIVETVGNGGKILFVGTKKQAQNPMITEAVRCGAYYVARRWLGGMLTNFQTIRKSIDRMKKIETILEEEAKSSALGVGKKFTKKEKLMMNRELEKLNFSLGGIRDLTTLPQLIFVIDVRREDISIKEAQRLDIPVIALVDTNCDPANVEFPIPSNDDGTKAIRLFCEAVSDAVLEGQAAWNLIKHTVAKEEAADTRSDKGRKDNRRPGNKQRKPRGGARKADAVIVPSEVKNADVKPAEAEVVAVEESVEKVEG